MKYDDESDDDRKSRRGRSRKSVKPRDSSNSSYENISLDNGSKLASPHKYNTRKN
jgi:hypothetical protein